MKLARIFLICVGITWAVVMLWLFLSIQGIASETISLGATSIYWAGMLLGPMSLIVGPLLLASRQTGAIGAFLVALGCVCLTAFALYNTALALSGGPLQAPPPYAFYAVSVVLMLLADAIGVTVVRRAFHGRP